MSGKSKFDELLEQIGVLTKSADTSGDAAIAAAAGDGAGGDNPDNPDNSDAPDETAASDAPEGEDMGKSLTLTLEDGTEIHAVDGAELVKALTGRQEALETKVVASITGLVGLVKSLQATVGKLSAAPQPRRSVIAVTERPAAAAPIAPEPAGMNGEEFMTKALSAQVAGKITGRQVAIAEQYLNAGQPPPESILRAVLS